VARGKIDMAKFIKNEDNLKKLGGEYRTIMMGLVRIAVSLNRVVIIA
jgi:hypothetical protein